MTDIKKEYEIVSSANESEPLLVDEDSDTEREHEPNRSEKQEPVDEPVPDERFNPPPPSPYKRAALLVFIGLLFWAAFNMKFWKKKPEIIYASRYSKEFKYRPAASPVITETLKDGRVRIRGGTPEPANNYATIKATPTSTPVKKKKGKVSTGKRKGSKRKAKAKTPGKK